MRSGRATAGRGRDRVTFSVRSSLRALNVNTVGELSPLTGANSRPGCAGAERQAGRGCWWRNRVSDTIGIILAGFLNAGNRNRLPGSTNRLARRYPEWGPGFIPCRKYRHGAGSARSDHDLVNQLIQRGAMRESDLPKVQEALRDHLQHEGSSGTCHQLASAWVSQRFGSIRHRWSMPPCRRARARPWLRSRRQGSMQRLIAQRFLHLRQVAFAHRAPLDQLIDEVHGLIERSRRRGDISDRNETRSPLRVTPGEAVCRSGQAIPIAGV